MDILATLKEIVAQMEADAAAQVVAAQTEVTSDPAPADPVVEAPVEASVEEIPAADAVVAPDGAGDNADDGSAANEPVPDELHPDEAYARSLPTVGHVPTQDPTPVPEATEQL